jgi:glyoxylase-like metal-dependent hydrolase (beta-lactamase superfamily II)
LTLVFYPGFISLGFMKTRSLLALALVLVAPVVFAQSNFANVKIKAIPVTNNIYLLESSGAVVGNIGVSVGPDGILLVDDGYAPLAEKIEAAVRELNPGKIKFVLNTHFHADHTGGNAVFASKGATIIAQDNVRKRLSAATNNPPEALPAITFDQSASIHFNGEDIKLIHYGPGHTDADSIVFFTGANVVHMGDQFVNGGFPFVDLNHGGSLEGYIKTITAVLDTVPADAKIIPGHGQLATVEDLRKYRDMLVTTSDLVKKSIAEGKTLDQLKADGLPDKWKDMGGDSTSTTRWIETIYKDTTRPPAH